MNTISSNQSDPKSRDEFAALAVIDDAALEKISGGLPSPEGDPNDFHPRIWPLIRTADFALADPDPSPWLVTDKLTTSIAKLASQYT